MSWGVLAAVVAIVVVVPGVILVLVGVRLLRRQSSVTRVAIEAVVVEYSNWRRAKRVTFDYPAPDGTWLRANRVVGLPQLQTQGFLVRPGDRIRVHVNPADPVDVSLGPTGSAGGLVGIVLVGMGAVLTLGGALVAVRMLGFAVTGADLSM